jgi:hypothetical protein
MVQLLTKSELAFSHPRRLKLPFAWVEHIPFAFFLVDILRPQRLVELGTHSGNSYNAFCQAVELSGAGTICHAVDTWEGDAHAGRYESSIYQELSTYQEGNYSGFSKLLRMTFDEALCGFEDKSIDLLHIDGLHTYEAVKHDFESWLPKVAPGGVILMHDIAVKEHDFGVWRLWEEIKENFQTSEFAYGFGLGVVFVGGARQAEHDELRRFLSLKTTQHIFSSLGRAVLVEAEKANLETAHNTLTQERNDLLCATTKLNECISGFETYRNLLGLPKEIYAQISCDPGDGYDEALTYRTTLTDNTIELSYVPETPLEGLAGLFVMPVNFPALVSEMRVTAVCSNGQETVLTPNHGEGLHEFSGDLLESDSDFPRFFFTESLPSIIKEIHVRYCVVLIGRPHIGRLQGEAQHLRSKMAEDFKQITQLNTQLMEVNSKTSQLESSLSEITASLSWRCTAPLRSFRSLLSSKTKPSTPGCRSERAAPTS